MIANIPWAYILPALVVASFVGGLAYKHLQDKTVQVIKHTLKPGDLHIDDLRAYAEKMGQKV